ncbi:choline transporter-like protein 3 isoform X1 [Oenanthe melanoleuca]|uniref:choline transporter-like protein 3 isoform X1 n=1 Tax=Oenanthe melanoleuca TaxID=2939378 RepID=UPI0024C1D98D|nr:choline transporter-like protein 3 isoform X1 [Oenanthe melanoleuca]
MLANDQQMRIRKYFSSECSKTLFRSQAHAAQMFLFKLGSGDSVSERLEWRPALYRKCTDTLWLLLFCLFWAGLMFISGYSVVAGAAERLVLGYDSFGNICGRKNTPVAGANLSGLDMTNKKYVFFLNSCSLEIQSLESSSLSLCVSSCPQQQLNSLEDLQSFARSNGSFLCVYNLDASSYTLNPKAAQLCPTLPVPPSKSFPLFNRCVPQNPECYSKYASVLINMVNEMDVFHRILSGILAGRDTVIGLSVLALAFSLMLVLAFRFIQTFLIHTLIALVVFGLLFVSGVLWWLHYDYRNDPSTELETEKENVKFLLGYAIFSTIVTVVLLSLIIVLRKRLRFAVQLFQIVGKFIGRIPFLLFQPLWTFLILVVFWVFWVAVLLSLGTAGTAHSTSGGQVEYRALSGICYMAWYHFVGLIWTSEFILACQQMVIAGAVVTCYFNRNKNNPPPHPVLSSISVLFCYHLGTAVKGSFLITVLRIPRIVLLYLYNILNHKENAKHLFNCCFCWICFQKGCLRYFNQHAYTTTAINGTNFCTSAKDAVCILARNSAKLASISYFGDFLLFLGKVFVVCFTVFGGLMAFNYHRELQAWVVPLLLVGFFAYMMSHSFLSVFEVTADALLLCFAIDMETNNGTAEKPYFVDQELLTFVSQSNKLTDRRKHRSTRPFQDNEDGTELQPMT